MARQYSKSRSKTTSRCIKVHNSQPVTEQELQQDLLALVARAEQAKTLTAMVTLVMAGLRVLGLKLVRMVLERRDEQMHRGRQGAPCCPRCGRKLRKPKRKWTTRELRYLAELKDSPYWLPLQLALSKMREQDQLRLLDESTDFAQTQFRRGRLSLLRDFVLLVTVEGPARYEKERREAGTDDDA